jgi:NADH-ubiquinone oxidoreductase chain 3
MTSTTFFFLFIPLLAIILLAVNLIFAPHNPYQEKDSAFECGFHSFLGQNRTQFSISFFIFALLFLLFDLEILLVYPYVVSAYGNGIYGLVIMLIFFLVLTLGFAFELGKNALKIDSRQITSLFRNTNTLFSTLSSIHPIGKFAGAFISIIIVASIKYLVSGDLHTEYREFGNNVALGLFT